MKTKIKIPQEVSHQLEALHYEVVSRRDILAYMISNGYDIQTDSFKAYEAEFQKFYVQYETCKQELADRYIHSQVPGAISWTALFDSSEVDVTYA